MVPRSPDCGASRGAGNGCSELGASTEGAPDDASRRVVGSAAVDLPRAVVLPRLRHLGGLPERALHVRQLSVAVLLAGDLGRLAARVLRAQARVVPGLAAVLAGALDPALPCRLSLHLLLLPRRLLQGVLGR